MSPVITKSAKKPAALSDTRLVRECRSGNAESWSQLIDKYKALIYSIPVKYNLSRQESADNFFNPASLIQRARYSASIRAF